MKRLPLGYKDTLGFEIEFNGISFDKVLAVLDKLKEEHKIDCHWELERESSVSSGLEIKSPIMNRSQKWGKEIATIFTMLNELGAQIDDTCGFHIHIGGQILENSSTYFQNMMLFWCHHEEDFIEYTKGNGRKIRKSLWKYARPLKYSLSEEEKELLKIDASSLSLKEYLHLFQKHSFSKIYTLNFQNLNYKMNTIEIRCPAATLNLTEVRNYIALFMNFMKEAKGLSEEKRKEYYQELMKIRSYDRNSFVFVDYENIYKMGKRKQG